MTRIFSQFHEAEVRDTTMILALLAASGAHTSCQQSFVPNLFAARPRKAKEQN